MVAIDTLALARKLEAAGFPTKQAQDTAAALNEAIGDGVATRRDIKETEARLERKIDASHVGMDRKFDAFRVEMEKKFDALRVEVESQIRGLRTDMEKMELRLTVRLGGLMVAGVAALAAIKFFG